MNLLRRFQATVTGLWERFRAASPNQRLLVLAVSVLGLLVLGLLGSRIFSTAWNPVFTNLQPGDAAAIATDLKAAAIPFQVSADGTSISVPSQDAGQARLAVAGKGALPSSGINWNIFTQSGLSQLGMSNFQRQVLYTQALETDLAQNIEAMQGVAVARVNLVLPQNSVFTTQSPPASAGVFLTVKPWAQIGGPEVAGIINLVTHAVPGLSGSNVSVVNNAGQVLLPGSPSTKGGANGSPLSQEIAFEHHLENNLNAVLEPVLGPGNVVARVTASLNFNQTSITRHRFTPVSAQTGQGLLQSLNQMKETFQGSGGAPLPSGISTNGGTPVYPTGNGGGTSSYNHTQTTQQFVNNETVTHTQVAPGAVNRLTVAVMVNQRLTPAQAQAIRSTVAAAIGYDPLRKDLISVVGMPFNTSLSSSLARAAQAAQQMQTIRMLLPWGAATLLGLVGLLWMMRRRRGVLEAQQAREEALLLEEAQARLSAPADDGEDARRQEHIRALTRQQPENVAEVVRAWLREE